MLASSARAVKITVINMLKDLVEKVDDMNKKIENFSKDIETILSKGK